MLPSLIPVAGLAIVMFLLPSKGPQEPPSVKPKPSIRQSRPIATSSSFKPKTARVNPNHSVEIDYPKFNSDKEYKTIYNYIRGRYKNVSENDAKLISDYIVTYGKRKNIDPKFVAAVIARESAFNKKAISPTGAKGLGQIKKFNFKSLKIDQPYDIKQNVRGTTAYLKKLTQRWRKKTDSTSLALASYYEGPNKVQKNNGKYEGNTKHYVNDILKKYEELKGLRKKY